MKNLFQEYDLMNEYDSFLQSFSQESLRGIRLNSLKIHSASEAFTILRQMYDESEDGKDTLQAGGSPESLFPRIPWSDDGYYIPNGFFPGRHLFYLAGLFYLQEPSAMLPANILEARPGEHILDLCAAPGGKTAKIAADMKGAGILISNDINETRVKALVRNVELMGCSNCIVLNESPENIARHLPGYFDKILLDAPCSGEGMFRRDPDAIASWEKFGNDACVKMQREILASVDRLLKPGGILVYSTCTFSTRENEEMIQWFLQEHPSYTVVKIGETPAIRHGLSHVESLTRTARIFPHHADGEGHFCAKLQKNQDEACINNPQTPEKADCTLGQGRNETIRYTKSSSIKKGKNATKTAMEEYHEFTKENFLQAFHQFTKDVLTTACADRILLSVSNHLQIIQGHVYTLPEAIPSLDGLKIAKKGLYLGDLKVKKTTIHFEPSHSFLISLNRTDLLKYLSFSTKDPNLQKYIKGETIFHFGENENENEKENEIGDDVLMQQTDT